MFPFSTVEVISFIVDHFFLWLGILVFLKVGFCILVEIFNGVAFFFNVKRRNIFDFKRFGAWAVITGSTDGIGKAFAEELADKGLNIVLISRSEEKLRNTAKEIEDKYSVKTLCVKADFKNRDCYQNIKENLKDIDIAILVNNVGIALQDPQHYYTIDEDIIWNEIDVNIGSVAIMTRIVLPHMVEKKKGMILNISSSSTRFSLPCLGNYAASKSFMEMFTYSVMSEVKKDNVIFKCLIPAPINTNMTKKYGAQFKNNFYSNVMFPDAKTYVRSAMESLSGDEVTTAGYWPFDIMMTIFSRFSWERKSDFFYKMVKNFNKKET